MLRIYKDKDRSKPRMLPFSEMAFVAFCLETLFSLINGFINRALSLNRPSQ